MKRILASIAIAGMALFFSMAPLPSTAKSSHMMKCPTGESYVKAYTKADGTKVDGYCRSMKSDSSTGSMSAAGDSSPMGAAPMTMSKGSKMKSCPAGETWVKAYKRKDGTKVAGYCRKA